MAKIKTFGKNGEVTVTETGNGNNGNGSGDIYDKRNAYWFRNNEIPVRSASDVGLANVKITPPTQNQRANSDNIKANIRVSVKVNITDRQFAKFKKQTIQAMHAIDPEDATPEQIAELINAVDKVLEGGEEKFMKLRGVRVRHVDPRKQQDQQDRGPFIAVMGVRAGSGFIDSLDLTKEQEAYLLKLYEHESEKWDDEPEEVAL